MQTKAHGLRPRHHEMLILRNHGLLTVGANPGHAFNAMYYLGRFRCNWPPSNPVRR